VLFFFVWVGEGEGGGGCFALGIVVVFTFRFILCSLPLHCGETCWLSQRLYGLRVYISQYHLCGPYASVHPHKLCVPHPRTGVLQPQTPRRMGGGWARRACLPDAPPPPPLSPRSRLSLSTPKSCLTVCFHTAQGPPKKTKPLLTQFKPFRYSPFTTLPKDQRAPRAHGRVS
jgi:hypothetical protein